ncbi:50S ribosomal protein L5 [Candidatus Woesearchaeota archaeon]|nr:50S ribosomal protein L5 [Candidatus Woesearchaeota archaeon]
MTLMQQIRIEKVTLNIGTGEPGDKLDKAVKLLQVISNEKPVQTKTKKRIPTWNIMPGLAIGTKVTLRKHKAEEMIKRLLQAVSYKKKKKKFDRNGNFSFGIKEYLDIPGTKYDAKTGTIGLEAAVTLERPGFGVKKRVYRRAKIPKRHLISKEEAIEFMKKKYNVSIE